MGNDPIALANYVINEIDLTDPMDYSDNGNVAEQSINPRRRQPGRAWEPFWKSKARPSSSARCWFICCVRPESRRCMNSRRETGCRFWTRA